MSANLRIWSMIRARALLSAGRLTDASAEAEAAIELSDEMGDGAYGYINHIARYVLGQVALHTGDLSRLLQARRAADRLCGAVACRSTQRLGGWLTALIMDAEGDPADAVQEMGLDPLANGPVAASSPRLYGDVPARPFRTRAVRNGCDSGRMNLTADTSIRPFRVDIPQAAISDLRDRLRATRYPPALPGDDWDTGIPSGYLRELVEAWHGFDFASFQARLNEVPQFTTVIEGQVIHFAHVSSPEPDAIPLLVTHGWPGSFLEFLHLIGPLTDPAAHGGDPRDAVHLVIASLPGFGFSTPLASGGWTTTRIATTWAELMSRLGYGRFAVHGGDIGAAVSPEVGRVVPDRVIGVHINGALGFTADVDEETLAAMTPIDRDRVARTQAFMRDEYGYIAIQSTRPGLVGVALTDSPAAQLAWMLDKLHAWTYPPDALPDGLLGREWILANASLYWLTASSGSSAYVGYAQVGGWGAPPVNSGVPTAAIQFAHDVGIRSRSCDANTIVRWTDVKDRGGHFAALEEPQLLVADIRQFLRDVHDDQPRI